MIMAVGALTEKYGNDASLSQSAFRVTAGVWGYAHHI
jgi:hypothetical protein